MKPLMPQQVGQIGEDVAVKFLVKHGYIVIERNYWRKWGEIDIVSRKDDTWHFVEVKATAFIEGEHDPLDHINVEKKRRLQRVIQTYVTDNSLEEASWQVDVLRVILNPQTHKAQCTLIPDIEL